MPQKETDPFSQIVWKKTTDFGIGRAMMKKNGRYCTVVVARYFPKGNIEGEFEENVKRGLYGKQTCEKVSKDFDKGIDESECNTGKDQKELGKFIEADISNAMEDVGKFEMTKPLTVSKEKEKARLNFEIKKVSEVIDRLEKEGLKMKSAEHLNGYLVHADTAARLQKQISKGVNMSTNRGFSDLSGTGSPVIVYHGVKGLFEGTILVFFPCLFEMKYRRNPQKRL